MQVNVTSRELEKEPEPDVFSGKSQQRWEETEF